jgi:hypothetical protein
MKKVLIIVLLLGLAASATAAPLLVEAYQEGQINIPAGENDTLVVTEVSFAVDSSCYVQFVAGGIVQLARLGVELDGERLPPLTMTLAETTQWSNLTYTYFVGAGEHTTALKIFTYKNDFYPTTCTDAYLQALIFLPDTGGAVAERPAGDADATGAMKSVISKGPYVTVTGASELVDATGRVIENAIEEDRVSINTLPQGTYFARDEERTVVKIVKVE